MKGLSKYNIEIYKLANVKHEYNFEIANTFFALFENSPVTEGHVKVHLEVDKRENLIEANFQFKGEITLVCDRCLENYQQAIAHEEKLIYKYGDEEKEIDEQVSIITKQTQVINIGQFIYESIALTIPFKKLHPKFLEEEYESEGGSMIYRDNSDEREEKDDFVDPRWEILKNLKNN